jgi:hypothetical protein
LGVFDEPSIEKTCVVVGLQRVFDGEVVCGHPPPESKLQCSRKEVRGKLIISFKASRDTAQDPGPQELTISRMVVVFPAPFLPRNP